MARKFRNKIRLKVGGTMNLETGVMAGGVVIGHFAASHNAAVSRETLTSAIANGPTVRDVDPDSDTCDITIDAEQDAVALRNLQYYAADGGYVEVVASDAVDEKMLKRYIPFKFGNFGASGDKNAAKDNATLVGTNTVREAEWIAAQTDMPAAPSGGGAGAGGE